MALVLTLAVTTSVAAYLFGTPTVNGALVAVGVEILALVCLGAYALWLREAGCRLVLRHLEVLRTRKDMSLRPVGRAGGFTVIELIMVITLIVGAYWVGSIVLQALGWAIPAFSKLLVGGLVVLALLACIGGEKKGGK